MALHTIVMTSPRLHMHAYWQSQPYNVHVTVFELGTATVKGHVLSTPGF